MVLGVAKLHGVAEKYGRDHGPRRDGRWLVRGLRGWWHLQAAGEQIGRSPASGYRGNLVAGESDAVLQRGGARSCVLMVKVRPQPVVQHGALYHSLHECYCRR